MHQNLQNQLLNSKTLFEVELKEASEKLVEKAGHYDPTLDLGSYKFPGIDLLLEYSTGKISVTKEELQLNKDKIVRPLPTLRLEFRLSKLNR